MRTATVVAMRAVILAARKLGVPRDSMLASVGMRWEELANYELRAPHATYVSLWNEISRLTGDPLIGVKIAREIAGTGEAALFEYTVRSAPTIAEAWDKLTSLLGLMFGDSFEVVTRFDRGAWECGFHLPMCGEPPIPRSEECLVVGFVEQCRRVAPAFAPSEICFQHAADAPVDLWQKELGCAIGFGAAFYGIRISERSYRSPIPGHDPSLAKLIEALAKPLLAAEVSPTTPADPAVRAIRAMLDRGSPVTVEAVATALHVSKRTLQRVLADSNTSVRAELERARKDAALVMLRDPRATVAEIAGRLGFADASQFTRAMKRWTGAAPTELRKRAASEPGATT